MKKDFHRHISSILPVARSILQSTVAGRGPDTSDEAADPSWKEAYYSLVLLEKILCQFPQLVLAKELEVQPDLFLVIMHEIYLKII